MDGIKRDVARSVQRVIKGLKLDYEDVEIVAIEDLITQVKVWPLGKDLPPRYFTVRVMEHQ
jgi:hypothetical protein